MKAKRPWPDLPVTPAGQALERVLTELARLWHRGERQRCLTNLPLLAEKLEQAGLHDEAVLAQLRWRIYSDEDDCTWIDSTVIPTAHYFHATARFTSRLFWFPPQYYLFHHDRDPSTLRFGLYVTARQDADTARTSTLTLAQVADLIRQKGTT